MAFDVPSVEKSVVTRMAATSPKLVAEKGMDVVESTLVYSWKLKDFEKKLHYDLHKCIGCGLCEKVCPVNAITMGPVVEVANGKLQETPLIVIDHEKCCYCFLCAVICPAAAITIEVNPRSKIDLTDFPGVGLWFEVDPKKCKKGVDAKICKACGDALKENSVKEIQPIIEKCPTGALKFRTPFEGEVLLYTPQLHRCDLSNCKVCFTLCPSKAIFVPQKADDALKLGKIAVDQEKCILCGACEACPEHLFKVIRRRVEIDQKGKLFSWSKAWIDIINDLIESRRKQLSAQQRPISMPQRIAAAPNASPVKKPSPLSETQLKINLAIAARATALLAQVKVRRWMEQGDSTKLKEEIQNIMKTKKG